MITNIKNSLEKMLDYCAEKSMAKDAFNAFNNINPDLEERKYGYDYYKKKESEAEKYTISNYRK